MSHQLRTDCSYVWESSEPGLLEDLVTESWWNERNRKYCNTQMWAEIAVIIEVMILEPLGSASEK